jgi:hypothetical protein
VCTLFIGDAMHIIISSAIFANFFERVYGNNKYIPRLFPSPHRCKERSVNDKVDNETKFFLSIFTRETRKKNFNFRHQNVLRKWMKRWHFLRFFRVTPMSPFALDTCVNIIFALFTILSLCTANDNRRKWQNCSPNKYYSEADNDYR